MPANQSTGKRATTAAVEASIKSIIIDNGRVRGNYIEADAEADAGVEVEAGSESFWPPLISSFGGAFVI